MPITFRTYEPQPRFSEDYEKVRAFFLDTRDTNFSYGRWDWMITHGMLDAGALAAIGLWERGSELVAVATYDTRPTDGYARIREGYEDLKPEVFAYAALTFAQDPPGGRVGKMIVPDQDRALQQAAVDAGFIPSQDREMDAVFVGPNTPYALPDGFSVTSLRETYDLRQYRRVLYKGFNHEEKEGPFAITEAELVWAHLEMERPNVNLDLKVAIVAPDGNFASYCGMWYDPAADFAIVEPVATDPAYRRMGLGRAAVLEGVRRCFALGAKRAFVGSSQQFYYSIGFRPYATATAWVRA